MKTDTYIARNAKANPDRWQDGLRELIASDPKRVEAIAEGATRKRPLGKHGFTLIELSTVLVIIGLVVGGVLVGQDLIKSAGERATITQIAKFNAAANTFYGKYGYLPGDIPAGPAAQFGFAARGPYPGQGDGNGVIMGNYYNTPGGMTEHVQVVGEAPMVWVDLSVAKLIDGTFNTANCVTVLSANVTGSAFDSWFPSAKLGGGNYFIAQAGDGAQQFPLNMNFYSLVAPTSMIVGDFHLYSNTGLTVKQAYDIDKKIDDGLPQFGNVLAGGMNNGGASFWAGGNGTSGSYPGTATSASVTTCYDNAGAANVTSQYSLTYQSGSNINCALSFKMQAAD